MDDFELELKNTFIDEAILNLEEAESCFMELESAPDPKPLLDQIFRLAHNLKGGSRSVGFGDVAEFTHELESLVLAIQKSQVALSTDVVSTLLRSNDWLVEMMTGLKNDMAARFDNTNMLTEVKSWQQGKVASLPTPAPSVEAPVVPQAASVDVAPEAVTEVEASAAESVPPSINEFFTAPKEAPAEIIAPLQERVDTPPPPESTTAKAVAPAASSPTSPAGNTSKAEKEDEVVRVNLSRIELLNDYVGELIVLQSVIQQQAKGNEPIKLNTSIQQMVKLSKDIQNLAMGLRMLPVKPLVQKLQRVVRDTSNALGKNALLELVGEQIDVDKSVLDRLGDPLIHVLRNAVDHGLESPEERSLAGKSAQGKIRLGFYNEGNYLIIEVTDDGKGINTKILRKKALEKKLIAEKDNLSEKQLIHLIFHPGFSTKEVTTEVSGRGVGMDVVKTNIDKIGGQVDVLTELGKGSTFRIKIPLSLAVIEGLVTATSKSRYVIPLSQVQETVNLGAVKIFPNKLGIGDCMELRGQVVPIYRLENLIEPKRQEYTATDSTALLFIVEEQVVAVSVQDLMHSQQVVIKPLTNGLLPQPGWVGSCVLGDGLPTLILSPVDLLIGKIKTANEQIKQGRAA